MKTKITICTILISLIAVAMFFSCDNPLALGTKLDVQGPVVTITSPQMRKSVPDEFDLTGTAQDNSGIGMMIIQAVVNNVDFPRRWRYQNGAWEVSDNYGASWSALAGAAWNGTAKSASWKIPVDMKIPGEEVQEGEYTFNVQAWDKADFSDDNSCKAVVVIVDFSPPKVDVSNPYLYRGDNAYTVPPLKPLHDILDNGGEKENPAYLGKFITQEFDLKWQVEDFNDVWSVDLRFYKHDVAVDNNPATALPDEYIYRFFKNVPPVPANVNPSDYIKPNGTVTIPDLTEPAGFYDQGGEIKTPVTEKTTIKVVAASLDAAGNPNQEKTIGYFIYWPKANKPWIAFSEGMKKPVYPSSIDTIEPNTFTVFPSKYIKATAYQAHGVKKIEYAVYECAVTGVTEGNKGTLTNTLTYKYGDTIENKPYAPGMYTTIFAWQFDVPDLTGYYVVKAKAFSNKDKESEEYEMLFRVNDITFPDFPTPVQPPASDSLFKAMNAAGQITISGTVADVTQVETLCLVWINPASEGYKAMNQLSYFRDKNYEGWQSVLSKTAGSGWITEGIYDSTNPNKLWKLTLTYKGINPVTNRREYTFSQMINLSDLNIGMNAGPLSSQVFLLRAENPAKQCTIITYAPQGDTGLPSIEIENVKINGTTTCYPNVSAVIQPFKENDTIAISGKWQEDSLGNSLLDKSAYFKNTFVISVNNTQMQHLLNQPSLSFLQTSPAGTYPASGTWALSTSVGTGIGKVPLGSLKDNLVVDVTVRDIGRNEASLTNSWLIQSDHLTLTRISSEMDDDTYASGIIRIFLEFSKPVKLADGITGTPELILSSDLGNNARARYVSSPDQNSRQYFEYTIASGHNTTTPAYLNVKGLWYNGAALGNAYNTANYPFAWNRGGSPGDSGYEEVRLTMQGGKDGGTIEGNYYVRTLPTTTDTGDRNYQLTLLAAKNIKVDTTAPTVAGISSTTSQGWYSAGDIYITVTFNEAVKLGATLPRLNLDVGGTTLSTSSNPSDVSVNENTVTFRYIIGTSDSSKGNEIAVNGYSGSITDIAGNALAANGITAYVGNKTLTGIYVETAKPPNPNARLFSQYYANPTSSSNVIRNDVNGNTRYGSSTQVTGTLSTLYFDELWLSVQPQGESYQCDVLEYSTDGGANWVTAPNTANNAFQLTKKTGDFSIVARQRDKAKNVSAASTPVTFTWDAGDIVSRVSSENANGTYSQHSSPINITVYFRKPVYFSAGQATISINAQRGGSNIQLTSSPNTNETTPYNSLTFTYNVANGDTSNGNNIDVVSASIGGVTAWDNTGATRVNISSLLTLPATTPKLDKQIKIKTGNLTQDPAPSFAADSGTEGNDNFHGIKTDDGSYWTTLLIPYDGEVTKGSGIITITPYGTNGTVYRLPAVLTEAQYNRFKSAVSGIDTYYAKGTNGSTGGVSDTTTKYVLKYEYDPASVGTGTGSIPAAFFEAFKAAETIKINVNAQAVSLDTTGGKTTLKVRLSGSNAPQVPGAAYTVEAPAGIVTDSIGNSSSVINTNVTLRGVAKPFVRVKKTQEVISTQAASANAPRFTAAQPMQVTARMDCRTPGSSIYFTSNSSTTNVTTYNFETGTVNPPPAGAPEQPTPQPTVNTTAPPSPPNNNTNYVYSTPITIGNNPAIADVQGYKWRVRARAYASTTSTYSAESEEIAYRTVITYQLRNGTAAITAGSGESILADGDQIWLRGGDAIGSSSIPGFPFTWEDNWNNLSGKRAGIRLMTKTNTTESLNNSVWKYVTWDLSATAYVDFIRGRDTGETSSGVTYTESTLPVIWQYGPKRWAYQRAGWTSFKTSYPIHPGEHRWCDAGRDHANKGAINFSATFSARPDLTSNYPNANQP